MKRFVCLLLLTAASPLPMSPALADHHHDWHAHHDWRDFHDHHFDRHRTFVGVGFGSPSYYDPLYYDRPYYYDAYYYRPIEPQVYTAHCYDSLEMDVQLALARR